jgi:hypothetical protein
LLAATVTQTQRRALARDETRWSQRDVDLAAQRDASLRARAMRPSLTISSRAP